MISTTTPRTSEIAAAIEAAWTDIRARHPDLPEVVVAIGAGSGAKGGLKLGHFAALRWQSGDSQLHELFIGGEGMRSGAAELLGTLLHEAAHALAAARELQDTSRGGRYHNRTFARLAEEVGLTASEQGAHGWSDTKLGVNAAEEYVETIADLAEALTVYRHAEQAGGRGARGMSGNNLVPAVCGCGRKIRAAQSTLDAGPIRCVLCATYFEIEE